VTDARLAEGLANVTAELRLHEEREEHALADFASELRAIQKSIATVADEVHEVHQSLPELVRTSGALLARANEHERRIRAAEMNGTGSKQKIEQHEKRLGDLEKLPHARPPYPSLKDLSSLDDDDGDTPAERTSPGGRRVMDDHRWAQIEEKHAQTERALDKVRQELDGAERARLIEAARAETAEATRAQIAEEAEEKVRVADAHNLARWRQVKIAVGAAGPVLIGLWEGGKHLFDFFVHLAR